MHKNLVLTRPRIALKCAACVRPTPNVINITTSVGHAMPQALSRRPLTAENRLQSHTSSCGAYGDKRPLQQALLRIHQFSRVSMIPTMLHIPSPITHTTAHSLVFPSFARARACVCVCARARVCVEKDRNGDRERISLLGTLRQRQCGTNVSSLKINRLLTSRYKTLHLLFMYLATTAFFSMYVYITPYNPLCFPQQKQNHQTAVNAASLW